MDTYIAPIADFADHSTLHNQAKQIYDAKKGQMVVVALKPIKMGEAISIDYGNHHKSNSHFWIKYGFIDRDLSF